MFVASENRVAALPARALGSAPAASPAELLTVSGNKMIPFCAADDTFI